MRNWNYRSLSSSSHSATTARPTRPGTNHSATTARCPPRPSLSSSSLVFLLALGHSSSSSLVFLLALGHSSSLVFLLALVFLLLPRGPPRRLRPGPEPPRTTDHHHTQERRMNIIASQRRFPLQEQEPAFLVYCPSWSTSSSAVHGHFCAV